MIRYADRKIFYHIHRVKSNSFLATARKRLEIVVLAIVFSQSFLRIYSSKLIRGNPALQAGEDSEYPVLN